MPQLDGVRGLAIFLVIGWHYFAFAFEAEPGSIAAWLIALLKLSWSGVDLFFVLSGFLIGGILIDNQRARNYFFVFYVRRALRILPLYLFWLLLFCVLLAVSQLLPASLASMVEGPIPLWSYATFTQNLLMFYHNTFATLWMGITWSLAVEEQFYCVLPLVIRYLNPRVLPWVLAACIFAAPMLRVYLSVLTPHGALGAYVLMPCRADALLLGVLCAWAMRQQKFAQSLKTHTWALYAVVAPLFAGTLYLAIAYSPYVSTGWQNLGYTWIALLYSCFLLIALTETRGIVRGLTMIPTLRKLGKVAYCVYLIHSVVLYCAHQLISQAPKIQYVSYFLTLTLALALTFFFAIMSWKFFEQPVLAAGHRLSYRRDRINPPD